MPSKTARISPEEDSSLNTLASLMLLRHLHLCTRDSIKHLHRLPKAIREAAREDQSRIIAVVGAGASAPLLSRSDDLLLRLEQQEDDLRDYKAQLDSIAETSGLERGDFETRLVALTRTVAKAEGVRRELAAIHNIRHPPRLTYELLAHLLKHRFLDAIITFNWDELLDQSLDDELGAREYIRVISERDCPRSPVDPSASNYIPYYIKIHGTASDAESLRFTREAYYAIPETIRRVIASLFGENRCVILNLGFGMGSREFADLLRLPLDLRVFNLSQKDLSPKAEELLRRGRPTIRQTDIHNIAAERWPRGSASIPLEGTDLLLDSVIHRLAQCTQETNGIVDFRNTARHRLLSTVLHWLPVQPQAAELTQYLKDRTTIEMGFSAVRGRGLVSVSSLVEDRCASYFDEYRRTLTPGHAGLVFREFCKQGGLRPSRLSNETFVSLEQLRRIRPQSRTDEVNESELQSVEIDLDAMAAHLQQNLSYPTRDCLQKMYATGGFRDALRDLQEGSEVELRSREDAVCSKVFLEPRILPSSTALRAETIAMLDRSNYSTVAVVAETGRWLLGEPYREILSRKTVFLILAFRLHEQQLRDAFPGAQIVQSHWWRHNRHMTLIPDGGEPGGIYFSRRRRSLFVTPVYVWRTEDLEILTRAFYTYWLRSVAMPPAVRFENLPKSFSALADAASRFRQLSAPPGNVN